MANVNLGSMEFDHVAAINNAELRKNIDPENAERTFFPDTDLQEPGVNAGEPR